MNSYHVIPQPDGSTLYIMQHPWLCVICTITSTATTTNNTRTVDYVHAEDADHESQRMAQEI